jgi:hypothetical protein
MQTRETVKVDRSDDNEDIFVRVIPLEEDLSRRLLSGELSDADLIVNTYVREPTVLEKRLIPEGVQFVVIISTKTLEIIRVTTIDQASQLNEDEYVIEIPSLVALSLLSDEVNFNEWKVEKTIDSYTVKFRSDSLKKSELFRNRTDLISLIELNPEDESNAVGNINLCSITFDSITNSLIIESTRSTNPEYFKGYFLAVTRKNDPSHLIKYIKIENNTNVKLDFGSHLFKEYSFFSSRFHILNSNVVVNGRIDGSLTVNISPTTITVNNSLVLNNGTKAILIIKNKFDPSEVYRQIKLNEKFGALEFLTGGKIDSRYIDVDVIGISKNYLKLERQHETAND